jgi:DNA polymerase-4
MCVLHLDLDAFFASVEQLKHPGLRGRPVAVGNGVVASPSYEARARGVATAMPIQQALRLCPDLVVLDGRHEVYRCFTDAVWEILRRHLPALETHLDEAFADLEGLEHVHPDPLALGRRLKDEILAETGLRCTVGVARNRMLAKLAAKSVKPDGLRVLRPDEEEPFLLALPASKIPGVGPKTAALLADLNVRTVPQLRALPRETLQALLGPRLGAAIHERAFGHDTRPVEEHEVPRQVSRETTLERPSADLDWLEGMLFYLVDRAVRALRSLGLRARGLSVRVRHSDGAEQDCSARIAPSAFDDDLQPAARALFRKAFARRVALRFLGVRLAPLEPADGQLGLFEDPSVARFHAAADAVRDRFGHGALVSGRAIALLATLPKDAYGYVLRTPSLTK